MEHNNYILPILILLPTLGAIALALFGPRERRNLQLLALGISTLTLVIAFIAPMQFLENPDAEFQFQFKVAFIPQLNSYIHLGMDGIALPLVWLTQLLSVLSIWSSFTAIKKQTRSYYALMLLLQAAMTGVFVSMDLLLFYIFFEFTLVPLFLIVGIWGGAQRRFAAFKLFIYTMAGGVLTFAAIIFITWYHSKTGHLTFNIAELYQASIPKSLQLWLFAAFFTGFAVKVPLFPFHTWLPLAHTEAPTAGSVILAGVLLKLGAYGFLRIALPILPDAAITAAPCIAVLALIGIIYTSLAAWIQSDIKKLVAYSSVAHLGFCILGMFAFNHTGLSASLLYMINHGLSTGALFLLVGMIYERYHTREFAHIGGLARKMPIMAFFLILFSLSSIGLPGLNGFVSEFAVLYAVFTSTGPLGPTYAIIAASGVILSAIYMLWMCQRVLFGPLKEPDVHHDQADPDRLPTDLSQREWGLLIPIAILVVVLGVYPKLYFNATDPAIEQLNQQITSDIKTTDSPVYSSTYTESFNQERGTRNEEPEALSPIPQTLDPKPYQCATAVSAGILPPKGT